MADHLATVAVRFAIVLGVFLLGITTLWMGRQGWRGLRWIFTRQYRTT